MNIKTLDEKELPKILFTTKAFAELKSMYTTTESKTYEFMYIGEVINENNIYAIKHIRLIPQCKISCAHCETDDEKYPIWLQENYEIQERKLVRFHGHSHVYMAVNPSGDDNNAIMKMMNYVSDFFIQFIMNQRGEYTLNLYNKKENLIYEHLNYYLITENGCLINPDNTFIIKDQKFEKSYTNTDNKIKLSDDVYLDLKTFNILVEDNYIEMVKGKEPKVKIEKLEEFKKVVEKDIKELNIKFPTSSYTSLYDNYGYGNQGYTKPKEKTKKEPYDPCRNCELVNSDFCLRQCQCPNCADTIGSLTKEDCDACYFNRDKLYNEYMKDKKKIKKGKKKNESK